MCGVVIDSVSHVLIYMYLHACTHVINKYIFLCFCVNTVVIINDDTAMFGIAVHLNTVLCHEQRCCWNGALNIIIIIIKQKRIDL